MAVVPWGKLKLGFSEQSYSSVASTSDFNRDHHVGYKERVLQEYPTDGAVLLAPMDVLGCNANFIFQQVRTLVAETINYVAGAALLKIVELDAWPFQEPVVIKELQTSEEWLRGVSKQRNNMR